MGLVDTLFNSLEKVINEHGSAAILRERLDLIKAQLAEQERRHADLCAEHEQMKARLFETENRARKAETELQTLRQGHNSGYCCDACGSPNFTRTGSRPDRTFGDLGIKEGLFTCLACGHVSAFTMEP